MSGNLALGRLRVGVLPVCVLLVASPAMGQAVPVSLRVLTNPCGGVAFLEFSTVEAAYVRIAIYDVVGFQVMEVLSQQMGPGTRGMAVDLSRLPSGQYFVRMDAGTQSVTKVLLAVAPGGSAGPAVPCANSWPEIRAATTAGQAFGTSGSVAALSPGAGTAAFHDGLGSYIVYFTPLTDLYPGMRALGCGVQFGCSFGSSGGINVSLDYTSTVFAEYDVINERGDCLGWYAPKNDEFALQVVLRFLDRFALSTRGRVLNSFLVPEWVLAVMPELGIDGGGSGLALLDDIGFSYWLTDAVAVEAQCVGSGSTIDYFPAVDGAEPLPALARLSGRGTFWRRSPVRTSAFLELAKPLNRVRQFALSDFHVSVGGEVVAWDIVAANLSYFRDFLDGRSTLGLGLSLGYKNWIRLGYSRILPLGGSLGSGHQGNLSVSMPLKW